MIFKVDVAFVVNGGSHMPYSFRNTNECDFSDY
jgi:hypothetical protein